MRDYPSLPSTPSGARTPMTAVGDQDAAPGRVSAGLGLLILAGLLTAFAPAAGVVRSADGSSTAPLLTTAWLTLLPAVVAGILLAARRSWAAAAVLGAGLVGTARLVADLGILGSPVDVLRPELFSVGGADATPLATGAGTWMLLVADLACLLAVLVVGPVVLAEVSDPEPMTPGRPRTTRSPGVMTIGLLAVAALTASLFANLVDGVAPPPGLVRNIDQGITGIGSSALLALVVAGTVLVAASLTAGASRGLLLGAGAAVTVPALIAFTAGSAQGIDGPLSATTAAWVTAGAGVALAGAGIFSGRTRWRRPGTVAPEAPPVAAIPVAPTTPGGHAARWLGAATAVAGAAAAALYLRADSLPQAEQLGRPEFEVAPAMAYGLRTAGVWTAAATLILIVGTLMPSSIRLGRELGRAGRVALIVALVPGIGAVAYAADFLAVLQLPVIGLWETGSGFRLGLVGAGVSALVAVGAVLGERWAGTVEADTAVALDAAHEWDERAPWPTRVAAALTVLVVVALVAPPFTISLNGDGPRLFGGLRALDVGAWLTLAAVLVLLWWAARTDRRLRACLLLVIAAALIAVRAIVPASVTTLPGYSGAWGVPAAIAVAALLLAAIPALYLWNARREF